MILLDTHVCIWWTTDAARLSVLHRKAIDARERNGIAVSAITVWETAMLVSKGRVKLDGMTAQQWLNQLQLIPTLHIVAATPQILVDSIELPGAFHKDPADQNIVATARSLDCVLLTSDAKILGYQHVRSFGPTA